jgi:hypothetical protein
VGPPAKAEVDVSGVLILEWLKDSPLEPRTGLELHKIIEAARPNWSTYMPCTTKADLLRAIESAASPRGRIVHIECHGCEDGLGDGSGIEFLTWNELNLPLQILNEASNCNSLVFVAACLGFAGISALASGPRAPAAALVGPADSLSPAELFAATVAFYQTLIGGNGHLTQMAAASTASSTVHFEPESMAVMAFDVWAERLIVNARPETRALRIEAARKRLIEQLHNSPQEADTQLLEFDRAESQAAQAAWDYFFMLDRAPNNATKFGVDFRLASQRVAKFFDQSL